MLRPRGMLFAMCILIPAMSALACSDCEYEQCFLGACACLPKSGCIVPHAIDPGRITEKLKTDPIGAIVNPLGTYNTTGVPLQGDVIEFAIKNPDEMIDLVQNPGRLLYTPVASAMIASRNAAIANGAEMIPEDLRPFLRRWYSDQLLNSIRWTSNWSALENTLQAAQMSFNRETQAITVLNAVIFRDDQVAQDPAIWAHEIVHVEQYADWGVTEFARSWVNNSSPNGSVEGPAYARQREANAILAGNNQPVFGAPAPTGFVPPPMPQGLPSGYGISACGCWGPVNPTSVMPAAQCNLRGAVPRPCPGFCQMGGLPWQYVCQ